MAASPVLISGLRKRRDFAMKKSGSIPSVLSLIVLALFLAMTVTSANAAQKSERDLDSCFGDYRGTYIMESLKNGTVVTNKSAEPDRRSAPCSTFKIFNSLSALDCGVVKDENEGRRWNHHKYAIKSWNRDHVLATAVSNSVVWYFQELASQVGPERMQDYLNKCDYGNKDISSGITRFWLGESLEISPKEQVVFLKRLVRDELPFSKRSMAIVRGMIKVKETEKGILYGKTGTDMKDGKLTLGWFVGYLATPSDIHVFATRIEAEDNCRGADARAITEKILESF